MDIAEENEELEKKAPTTYKCWVTLNLGTSSLHFEKFNLTADQKSKLIDRFVSQRRFTIHGLVNIHGGEVYIEREVIKGIEFREGVFNEHGT